jgi:hypothetical protein
MHCRRAPLRLHARVPAVPARRGVEHARLPAPAVHERVRRHHDVVHHHVGAQRVRLGAQVQRRPLRQDDPARRRDAGADAGAGVDPNNPVRKDQDRDLSPTATTTTDARAITGAGYLPLWDGSVAALVEFGSTAGLLAAGATRLRVRAASATTAFSTRTTSTRSTAPADWSRCAACSIGTAADGVRAPDGVAARRRRQRLPRRVQHVDVGV